MKLSETVNVETVTVLIEPSVDGTGVLAVWCEEMGVGLDRTTAAELIPILQHFIKTGGLPE